jgi:hypothetical protein
MAAAASSTLAAVLESTAVNLPSMNMSPSTLSMTLDDLDGARSGASSTLEAAKTAPRTQMAGPQQAGSQRTQRR